MFWECVLTGLAFAAVALILQSNRLRRMKAREAAWRPNKLAGSTIAHAERTFKTVSPFRLIARVDRVYRTSDSRLALVELKRRGEARAYLSDIIELSAQKLAIEESGAGEVESVGYVLTESPGIFGKRTAIPVSCWTEMRL